MPRRKRVEPEVVQGWPKSVSFSVEMWSTEQAIATFSEENAKITTEKLMNQLGNLLSKVGFVLPVVINQRTGKMVGGHSRVLVAKRDGIEEVPVHLVDLSEADERELRLALSKIDGKWDFALLEEALQDVAESNNLMFSGFTEDDMVAMLSGSEAEFEETFEEFAGRFAGRQQSDLVVFRSPEVSFSCKKPVYETLVQRLYTQVGVDDTAATYAFFQQIGLPLA